MGRKRVPGLLMRAGVWHVDKRICGRRVCQSTGTADIQDAERYLAKLMEQIRQVQVYGVRPTRTFEQAAAKFVLENQHKRSIGDDVCRLKDLMPFIGGAPLDLLHMGTLRSWIAHKRKQDRTVGTINNGLQVVRRIANLARRVDRRTGSDVASVATKDQAAAEPRTETAVSTGLDRARCHVPRAAEASRRHGALRGEHWVTRFRDLWSSLGLGSPRP